MAMKIQRVGEVLAHVDERTCVRLRNLAQLELADFKLLRGSPQVDCRASDIVLFSRELVVPTEDFLFPTVGAPSSACLSYIKCILNMREDIEKTMMDFAAGMKIPTYLQSAINRSLETVPLHGKYKSTRTKGVEKLIAASNAGREPVRNLGEIAQAGCSEEMFDAPPAFHGTDSIQAAIRCQDATRCQAAS